MLPWSHHHSSAPFCRLKLANSNEKRFTVRQLHDTNKSNRSASENPAGQTGSKSDERLRCSDPSQLTFLIRKDMKDVCLPWQCLVAAVQKKWAGSTSANSKLLNNQEPKC